MVTGACKEHKTTDTESHNKTFTDVLGRNTGLNHTPGNVITMRSGAVRLMAYMQVTDKMGYIELNDLKRNVAYMMACPELKNLPVIGAGNNYDPEAIISSNADALIVTNMETDEAEALSQKVLKPVICLKNGDLYLHKNDFYQSLKVLGKVFNRENRADSLISFIEKNISDVISRVGKAKNHKKNAYVGGIAYNGVQSINSTRMQYPPFEYLKLTSPVDNLPAEFDSLNIPQKNLIIDKEQIIEWNTDYLFLDVAGQPLWNAEIEKPVFKYLKSFSEGNVYTLLPFNWNSLNHENILCNMWFIGKVVYPEQFADVDISSKCKEIIQYFYGRNIYDQVITTKIYTNNDVNNTKNLNIYAPFEKIILNGR